VQGITATNPLASPQLKRMCWTVVLTSLLELAEEDGEMAKKREVKAAEKARDEKAESKPDNGGVLAVDRSSEPEVQDVDQLKRKAFEKHWKASSTWMEQLLVDAIACASEYAPRGKEQINKAFRKYDGSSQPLKQAEVSAMFATSVWPSLKSRGWKAQQITEGDSTFKTRYSFEGEEVRAPLRPRRFCSF